MRALDFIRKGLLYVLHRLANQFSDEKFLRIKYFIIHGKRLNLDTPNTFSEKLQWLKLYNRNPLYTILVDKVKVKDWVSQKIGSQYIIPTIAVYEKAEDINFESLPEKFVIKCNHNSGKGMYICKDRTNLNEGKIRKNLRAGLKQDYFITSREWPYKDVPRRILVEQFMENGADSDLADYKFFCFNGEPKYCQVIKDRTTDETIDFFDMNWIHQPFIGLTPGVKHSTVEIPRPKKFELMKEIVAILAKDLPFSRIDLYDVNGEIFFGEVTFFPASGSGVFSPKIWNEKIGDLLELPSSLIH